MKFFLKHLLFNFIKNRKYYFIGIIFLIFLIISDNFDQGLILIIFEGVEQR